MYFIVFFLFIWPSVLEYILVKDRRQIGLLKFTMKAAVGRV